MANHTNAKVEVVTNQGFEDFLKHIESLRFKSEELKSGMCTDELAKDLTGAELLLDKHQDNKRRIMTLDEEFRIATINGQKLMKYDAGNRLKQLMNDIATENSSLWNVWEDRQRLYEQCRDLQKFYVEIEEANNWIDEKQAALAEEEDALDFDALVKKQEDLERAVAIQDEKIKALDQLATKLIDGLQQFVTNHHQ